ncbi:MAG TPA: hypothetical protein VHL34_14910 [Rhizomicrobium sp.]|nr:hypothetical protein [Rhizomicrobium sp.]
MSEDLYRNEVEAAASRANGTDIVLNRTPAHAAVIAEFIFDKAEVIVEILTESVEDPALCNEKTAESAVAFLKKGPWARIDMLVARAADRGRFISEIAEAGLRDRVEIHVVPPTLLGPKHSFFMVADGRHYRYQRDRNELQASVQFGNEDLGGLLQTRFRALKRKAAPTA